MPAVARPATRRGSSTGSRNVTQTITQSYENYYLAEYRVYWGYDKSLKTGPYNFGFLNDPDRQNWVEHFPYQNGLLVWYLDYSYPDNNVGDYCLAGNCGGFFLPVDAHPNLLIRPDGKVWRPRIQSYDSTFGLAADGPHPPAPQQCRQDLRRPPGQPGLRRHRRATGRRRAP